MRVAQMRMRDVGPGIYLQKTETARELGWGTTQIEPPCCNWVSCRARPE